MVNYVVIVCESAQIHTCYYSTCYYSVTGDGATVDILYNIKNEYGNKTECLLIMLGPGTQ
jgi:hypothetical protein